MDFGSPVYDKGSLCNPPKISMMWRYGEPTWHSPKLMLGMAQFPRPIFYVNTHRKVVYVRKGRDLFFFFQQNVCVALIEQLGLTLSYNGEENKQ